jgi:hypothetical protein
MRASKSQLFCLLVVVAVVIEQEQMRKLLPLIVCQPPLPSFFFKLAF